MHLHRFSIGIQFNERMFRLPSVGGEAIDAILKLRNTNSRIGSSYFSLVNMPLNITNEYSFSLVDEKKENSLTIGQDQFLFKKTSSNAISALNIDKIIEEFEILWKTADKLISFGEIRRIGFVGEFRINEKHVAGAGSDLVECLTKFDKPENCSRFHLTFEDRKRNKNGAIADKDTDDFWNSIFSFYISDLDETPEKGKINANLDIQKYYNPAKTDPIKELKVIKNAFTDEKIKFKAKIKEMGLSE